MIISSVILLLVPDLRKGSGLPLTFFSKQDSSKKLSFNQAVNAAGPAVVNIYSQSISTAIYNNRKPVERTNLGSGVIMDVKGHILTCYHVIANAAGAAEKLILVGLQDGSFREAQIVGFDDVTDLAVLNISAENLHVIPQLDDPKALVGDVVLAIGNPYNLGQTITQGIVSRISNNGLNNFFDYIQTDAVLNEGNSGGALVDSEGVLIGINNANFKTRVSANRIESVDGVSFAVPYALARKVMDEIITTGRITRGSLGFSGVQSNPSGNGILVVEVSENSPAEIGGLKVRDVIMAINGTPSNEIRKALDYISGTAPGSVLTVDINRNGQPLTLKMTVASLR